jgi:hypothetical protein
MPTHAALEPRICRNGPTIERPPSYVQSAKKLELPTIRTKTSADPVATFAGVAVVTGAASVVAIRVMSLPAPTGLDSVTDIGL